MTGRSEEERGGERPRFQAKAQPPPGPDSPAPDRLLWVFIRSKVCALTRSREGRELGRRGEEGAPEGAGAPGK